MGVVGVAVLCVLVSAALSAELRGRYAALLRAFVAALVAALYGAPATQAPARGAPASLTGLHGAPPAADVQRAPSPRRRDTLPPPPPPPPGPVASWSVAHVGAWLACIELAEHAAAFEAASVDGALLLQLTPDELRALGVTSPLHVKKIRLRLLLAGAAAPQTLLPPAGDRRVGAGAQDAGTTRARDAPGAPPVAASSPDSDAARSGRDSDAPQPPPPPTPGAVTPPLTTSSGPSPPTRRESLLLTAAQAASDDVLTPRSRGGSSRGGSATLPSTSSRACVRVLHGHADWVIALAWLPDGRLLSGSADATVRVWQHAPGAAAASDAAGEPSIAAAEWETLLEGHAGAVRALAPLPPTWESASSSAPHTVCFVSAGDDATLRVWRLSAADGASSGAGGVAAAGLQRAPCCVCVLCGHTDAVYALQALPDGRVLSASADRTLRLWRPVDDGGASGAGATATAVLEGHTDFVLALAALPPSARADVRAVSASWDATLRVWSLGLAGEEPPGCERTLVGHAGPVRCVAALPRANAAHAARCVSGSADGTLRVWDADAGSCERVLQLALPAASRLAAAEVTPAPSPGVLAVAPLGEYHAAVASDDGSLRVWALDRDGEGACERSLRGHTKKVYALAAAEADGLLRLASGSRDRSVRLWEMPPPAAES